MKSVRDPFPLGHGPFPKALTFYVPHLALDLPTGVIFSDSVDEVVTTTDTINSNVDFSSTISETTTTLDTTSAIGILLAAGSESVSTTDTQSALAQFVAALTESISTADTQDATVTTAGISATVSETVSLTDQTAATADVLSSVLETYIAADLSQGGVNTNSTIAEILSALDTLDGSTGGLVFDVDIIEVISLRDFQDATGQGGGKRWKYPKPIKVRSSNIDKIAYDKDSKNLAVKFKTERVYNYSNVEAKQVKELRKSKSPGGYLHSRIIGNHPTVKMR